MSKWLSVFEGKALAEALTASGYSVSEKTVQRWKKGQTTPKPQDITAIYRLLGVDKPKSPPAWAGGLVRMTVEEVLTARDAKLDAQAARLEAQIERLSRLPDEPPASHVDEGTDESNAQADGQ